MTHTIEGDNIHFTFISPEGKQRKITLSLSEDDDLVNQILSIKDRTSREAALGYLFVNGPQEPRSETQLLSLTDPKQDVLTIQDYYEQIKSIDGLIESLKEKLKAATPEQKKEYTNRIKELEKDKKRLQQQADLIKNKTNGRTQTTTNIEQLLMIATNPEIVNEKFENTDEFKNFLSKVEEDIKTIKTMQSDKLIDGVSQLKNLLTEMDQLINSNVKYDAKISKLNELKTKINNLWEEIKKSTEEVKQEMEQQTQKANEKIEESNKITNFLKIHPSGEKITKDNLKENLQFVIDNLNEQTRTDENFRNKIRDIIYKLNLNRINEELEQQKPVFYYQGKNNNKEKFSRFDYIVPSNIGYSYQVEQLFDRKQKQITGWGYITNFNNFKNTYKIRVDDLPWNTIVKFINKCKEVSPPPNNFTDNGFRTGLGFNQMSEPLGGFKDLFTSKKVKENMQTNNEDIKMLKSQISDLKEELTEIKNLIKAQHQSTQQPTQQSTEKKNFQNYLKDIENITMSKLRHTEPNQKPKEEPNEIAKKILDRRVDLMPDYSTDDDEPWDD